jgi:hypothetical protein
MKTIVLMTAVSLLAAGLWISGEHGPGPDAGRQTGVSGSSAGPAQTTADVAVASVPQSRPSELPGKISTAAPLPEEAAKNFQEQWARLDADGYTIVSGFSNRYSDALQFYSDEQRLWMRQRGYPTPDEILAAANFTTDELRQLSATGNGPVTAMLLDRLITSAAGLGKQLLSEGTDPFMDSDFVPLLRDIMHYLPKLYGSGTPFAGYVDARAQMEVFGINSGATEYGEVVAIALKGLAYAYSRGDNLAKNRALWLADEAGVDPQIFEHYLSYASYYANIQPDICQETGRTPEPMPYAANP